MLSLQKTSLHQIIVSEWANRDLKNDLVLGTPLHRGIVTGFHSKFIEI